MKRRARKLRTVEAVGLGVASVLVLTWLYVELVPWKMSVGPIGVGTG